LVYHVSSPPSGAGSALWHSQEEHDLALNSDGFSLSIRCGMGIGRCIAPDASSLCCTRTPLGGFGFGFFFFFFCADLFWPAADVFTFTRKAAFNVWRFALSWFYGTRLSAWTIISVA